jgi:hypothetical protein
MMARRTTIPGILAAGLLAAALVAGGCEGKKEGKGGGAPAAGPAAKVEYANVKCPIMGNPIDPAKVTADLSRDWKGLKVAFCCPGCPGPWDKLTDAEKATKLKPVLKPGVALPAGVAAETTPKPAPAPTPKPTETKPPETKPAK